MNRFFFLAVLLKGLVQLEVFVQLLGDLSNAGLVIAAASAELPVQVLARPEPVELGHGFGVVGKNLAVNLKKYLNSFCSNDPKLCVIEIITGSFKSNNLVLSFTLFTESLSKPK